MPLLLHTHFILYSHLLSLLTWFFLVVKWKKANQNMSIFHFIWEYNATIRVNPSIHLGWDWPLPSFHCQSLFTFKEYVSCYDENKYCEFVNKNNLMLMCFLSRKIFKWFPSSLTQWIPNPFDKKFSPPLFVNTHLITFST